MRRINTIGLVCVALFISTTAGAAIPETLHYSGKLNTGNGAFTGTVDVTFSLYEDTNAATSFWTDTQAVAVTNGRFHVTLGPLSAATVNVSALHLGVTVGTDDEMDKVAIASVPYALRAAEAGNALTVGGQGAADFASVVHSHGLADLEHPGCTAGQVLSSDGSGWVCGDDGKLTEDEVEDYIQNDAIYLADGSRIGGVPVSLKGTGNSLAIGNNAGSSMTANYNVLMGSSAGSGIADGMSNTYLGHGAGRFQTGDKNVSVGSMAMYGSYEGEGSTGDFNTVMGYDAGRNVTSASHGIFIGYKAGTSVTSGTANVFLGDSAGYDLTTSSGNVGLGYSAARNQTGGYNTAVGNKALWGDPNDVPTGEYNVALGMSAGLYMTSGSKNTLIGVRAGEQLREGENNVFLGYEAGRSETGSNFLYIDNSNTDEPLIKGDFSANTLTVHGKLGVGVTAAAEALEVAGSIKADSIKFADGTEQTTAASGGTSGGASGSVSAVMYVYKGQACPSKWTKHSIGVGIFGGPDVDACLSPADSQCSVMNLYKGQGCPLGWTKQSIGVGIFGGSDVDACYRCQ